MPKASLRDVFLATLQKNGASVTLFLKNGVKLQGDIHAFDQDNVTLARDGRVQLIERDAVSTYMPDTGLQDELDKAMEGK